MNPREFTRKQIESSSEYARSWITFCEETTGEDYTSLIKMWTLKEVALYLYDYTQSQLDRTSKARVH